MRISVLNMTRGLLSDREVLTTIRAVNRQIAEDFAPYWNLTATLRLEGHTRSAPDYEDPVDMQGEGIIYLWDKANVPDSLGYHEANHRGVPYGIVFVDIATEIGEQWTVTFSHEALELLGDRQANRLVRGPDPRDRRRQVYHWHEMCDAVQAESYSIDGVRVSNFVLPMYFTPDSEPGSRNDFLGTRYNIPSRGHPRRQWREARQFSRCLQSFGVNPGGFIGFFDAETNEYGTFLGPDTEADQVSISPGDTAEKASRRQRRKNKARMARRGNRYNEMGAQTARQGHRIEKNSRTRVRAAGRPLAIRCQSHSLRVYTDVPGLRHEREQTAGYFAHDIYATAKSVYRNLKASGLQEVATVAIDPVQGMKVPGALVEIDIGHTAREHVIAVIDVDGILFWHLPKSRRGKRSRFRLRIRGDDGAGRGLRAAEMAKSRTIIRFIVHKLTDALQKLLKTDLPGYLARTFERVAFRKKVPGEMKELRLLKAPLNGTIGEISKDPVQLSANGRYLLLIHGIFSSTKAGFGEWLLSRNEDNMLAKIAACYDRVISFDHWTVARSTLENAKELLAMLPSNCQIDIVCHSRGAGIARCLLEHPALELLISNKNLDFGKVIFVAGACQGSPLASPDKISQLVNVFSALTSLSGTFLPLTLFTGLLRAVQYGVKRFPGIQSMALDSPIISDLNRPVNQTGVEYIYMRSDYEPTGKLAEMLDEAGFDEWIFGGRNDLVVPYEGAGTFDPQVVKTVSITVGPQFGVDPGSSHDVFHTAFFEQPEVRAVLLRHLAP